MFPLQQNCYDTRRCTGNSPTATPSVDTCTSVHTAFMRNRNNLLQREINTQVNHCRPLGQVGQHCLAWNTFAISMTGVDVKQYCWIPLDRRCRIPRNARKLFPLSSYLQV